MKREAQEQEPSVWSFLTVPRLIFFTIVVTYLLLGATILHVLEGDDDDENGKEATATVPKPQSSADVNLTKVVEQLWDDSQNEEISEEEWKKRTEETIRKIDEEDDDDENEQEDNISWTFAQSFLYITASLTRIGSTVQPGTFLGRLFVLLYTFFGVPLLLIFFADLGKIFVNLLQAFIEYLQTTVKRSFYPSISTPDGDIDIKGFVLAVTAMLCTYLVVMSLLFRMWCGGSIFSNIYNAFLVVFGVGPAPIGGTEKCASVGVFSVVPTFLMTITAPIAWSLTNMQTDLMGTEYIRKIHTLLRKFKMSHED